ncbi:hypothetical protein diail_8545 [Diaporthe ilicicola]|nr:hypothetical protein diail_8545 [Diaporthe ilicicola]
MAGSVDDRPINDRLIVDLEDHINDALRESQFPTPENGDFAPKSTLSAITNYSVTHTIWSNSTSFETLGDSDRGLVEFISGQASEVFAIGICMDIHKQKLGDMMRLFMSHDKSDRNLPLSDAEMETMWPKHKSRRRLFKDFQYLFRAQHFPLQNRFSVISVLSNTVLPILESQHMSQGQFGIVYKVKLHEEFLDSNDPIRKARGVAAIKELRESIENEDAKRAWKREVKALQRICELRLPHVVDIAAMIAIGKKQYFLFPWANGGNLLDLWKSQDSHHDRSRIASQHIPGMVNQLVGLSGALARLHSFQHGKTASYRHGDLKPQNILIFDSNNHNCLGVWRMADLGLARYHMAATGDRLYVTSNSGAGTISYQPPESVKAGAAATSRLYDIWSMGCIILQLITWLVYGIEKIDEITRSTKSPFANDESSYWIASWEAERGYRNIKLHPAVQSHIAQMKHDVRGSRALQDLLSIIEDKLLVVKLPEKAAVSKLNDTWVKAADKKFVLALLSRPELRESIASDMVPKAKLCKECENMDFFAENFQIIDTAQELSRKANLCDFCKMRWNLGKDSFCHEAQSIWFARVDSELQLNHRPVISFLACHEDSERDVSDLTDVWPEFGLPRLPPVGRETGRASVRLYETKHDDALEYIALSHPWGPASDGSPHFCTYPEDLGNHLQGIPLKDLPQTFQDAVEATRRLNQQYLWIDSICIVQGPKGDFNEQAKHMEVIFRQAYCVLAASCAKGQQDGFMKPRDERTRLKIHQERPDRPPIYACDFIDNFQQHALESHLNQRGWVLQERALARRTIFFTEKQTYWECGAGVRCETTMKMRNKLASFLGDSRFPEVGMRSTHGGKIRLFQDLYSKYSRLELSYDADRPVAIAGIEKHLISSFDVRGGFGVLDDGHRGLLWRSLLWQRAQDPANVLKRIEFEKLKGVAIAIIPPPSWSWMAHKGSIDYLDLPFNEVEWEEDDIRSRWSGGTRKSWSYSGDYSTCPLELTVHGRSFDLQAARVSESASIVLDDPGRTDELAPFLKCVVLGRLKGQEKESRNARTHYVLLVTLAAPQDGRSTSTYNRVGVGYMPGALIDFGKEVTPGELR